MLAPTFPNSPSGGAPPGPRPTGGTSIPSLTNYVNLKVPCAKRARVLQKLTSKLIQQSAGPQPERGIGFDPPRTPGLRLGGSPAKWHKRGNGRPRFAKTAPRPGEPSLLTAAHRYGYRAVYCARCRALQRHIASTRRRCHWYGHRSRALVFHSGGSVRAASAGSPVLSKRR